MSWQTSRKTRLTQVGTAIIAALAVQSGYAREDIMDTTGLADYIAGSTDVQPLKDYGVTWGGWLQASVTANANAPADGYNGPMTFNDRSGQVQMNQVYFYLQKAIAVNGDEWDWGGRFDGMYGSDSILTQAYGTPYANLGNPSQPLNRNNWDLNLGSHNNLYNSFALPQAYASLNVPFGNGVDVKVGHFYTPIGYEVVTAPDNFFMSKPYTFQYGEPFTHTGFLANYAIDENWSASAGGVTGSATGGWDGGFNTQLGNWDFLGGAGWTSDDKSYSLNVTGTAGNRSYTNPGNNSFWGIYSIVGKANWFDDDLHYVIQHDHGYANGVSNGMLTNADGTYDTSINAQWYGINQYLMYDIEDNLGVGLRAEWFRDANGFRVAGPARCGASTNLTNPGNASSGSSFACSGGNASYLASNQGGNNAGGGANYYELTAGLNYKPLKWVILRPNARYDFSQGVNAFMSSTTGTMLNYQFTFSFDATIVF
jgi:hypothetical protein